MAGTQSFNVKGAGSGGFSVDVEMNLGFLEGIVADHEEAVIQHALVVIDDWAENDVTPWMKANRRWTDRTGEARRTLGVVVELKEALIEIALTGGVFYMAFLEQFFRDAQGNPRFSILEPALDHWAPILLERLGAERE